MTISIRASKLTTKTAIRNIVSRKLFQIKTIQSFRDKYTPVHLINQYEMKIVKSLWLRKFIFICFYLQLQSGQSQIYISFLVLLLNN